MANDGDDAQPLMARNESLAPLRALRFALAGALAGTFLTLVDLGLGRVLGGPGLGWSSFAIAGPLLPILALALLTALLPDRLGPLLPATAAWALGHALALGPSAARMPLASNWDWLAALLALVGFALIQRRTRSSRAPSLLVGLASLALIAALFVAAARFAPGRYQVPRLFVNLLLACLLIELAFFFGRRIGPGLSRFLVLAAALCGGLGFGLVLIDDSAADWAVRHSSLSEYLVAEARHLLLPEIKVDAGAEYRHRPVIGSDLGRQAVERLKERGGAPRGVLFITVDAMRADLQRREVGGRPVIPGLDRLGREAVRFDRAYSPAPMTQFSVFSFLAGWYPSQFLSHQGGFDDAILITDRLRAKGVETRACYPKGMLTIGGDLCHRFDLGFAASSLQPWDDLDLDATFEALRPRGDGRWFSYLHLMRPHHPYDSAAPEFRAGESEFERFAAEVRHCDAFIGSLRARFAEAGLADDMWLVVSADHGEEFGEHGAYQHSTQIFEESVHVPLIVAGRGLAPIEIKTPVSLVDLPPTLHQLFDLAGGGAVYAGRSLLPLLLGLEDAERPETILVENPPLSFNRVNARAGLVGPRLKLIADERSRRLLLFDLIDDPGETRDLAVERPEVAMKLYSTMVARRRFGGEGKTIFADLESFTDLIDEAARRGGAGAVFSYYQWMKGLAREDELRILGYLVERPSLDVETRLDELLAERDDPDLALVMKLFQAALERPSAEAWAALALNFGTRDSLALDDAILSVALNQGLDLPRLPEARTDDPLLHRLYVALYHLRRRGEAPRPDDVTDGLASNSPWLQLLALRLTLEADFAGDLERVREIRAEARGEGLRVAAMRLLAQKGGPAFVPLFLTVLREGAPLGEAAVAAWGLARLGAGLEGCERFACAEQPAELEGLEPTRDLFFRPTGSTFSLPGLAPGGAGRLALFLRFPVGPGRRVLVRCGQAGFAIDWTPSVATDAFIVDIDQGGGDRMEFRLEGIDASELEIGGYIWVPRP